jgi:hypothetical protein
MVVVKKIFIPFLAALSDPGPREEGLLSLEVSAAQHGLLDRLAVFTRGAVALT